MEPLIAEHISLTIRLSSSILPTKILGKIFSKDEYWFVGRAISNSVARETSIM
jgi:hypothetical protein